MTDMLMGMDMAAAAAPIEQKQEPEPAPTADPSQLSPSPQPSSSASPQPQGGANNWYKPRTALFWPHDLRPLSEEWTALGLKLSDAEFKHLRRDAMLSSELERSFVTSDDLAMELLNLIAYRLDGAFQKNMRALFKRQVQSDARVFHGQSRATRRTCGMCSPRAIFC